MIDLNKYYVSTEYQGASGGSEGRSGYVPKALSGDELKYLRGDGTWQFINSPNLPVPKIKLIGPTGGPSTIDYLTYSSGWNIGGTISLETSPYLVVSDFTQEDLDTYQIFIEMVIFKRTKGSGVNGKVGNFSYTVPCGTSVSPLDLITKISPPWGINYWQRSGDKATQTDSPRTVVDRYNYFPVKTLNSTISLARMLNGHFRERSINYLDSTSTYFGDYRNVSLLVPFGNRHGDSSVGSRFPYSQVYRPHYIAFRYICWLPQNNNGKGQIVSGPLSPTIRVANKIFPFRTNHYQSSLKGFFVCDLNSIDKTQFICTFC